MAHVVRVVMGLILAACLVADVAVAQQEQWLQYRTSREPQRYVGSTGYQSIDITLEKPDGLELPELQGEAPLFGRWQTSMDAKGFRHLAIVQSRKGGPHDRLLIDADGDGKLAGETAVEPSQAGGYRTDFGPVRLTFQGDDGPVAYHLLVHFRSYDNERRSLYVEAGGWYEGDVTVDGQTLHCFLVDGSANGVFDDASEGTKGGDRIRFGQPDNLDGRFVGKYITLSNKLHRLEVARDGAWVRFTPVDAATVPMGHLVVPKGVAEVSVAGANGLFRFGGEQADAKSPAGGGEMKVPAGKYAVWSWKCERTDKAGVTWEMGLSYSSSLPPFDVAEGASVELEIGEPVTCTLSVRQVEGQASYYSFGQGLQGRMGEQLYVRRDGKQPPAPTLRITSQDKSYDRTFRFEYG